MIILQNLDKFHRTLQKKALQLNRKSLVYLIQNDSKGNLNSSHKKSIL